jgi:DNA-binding transcriptional regulator LsrR (DeoR family)
MSEAALAHVARLYFLRDLTQQQIAARLGVSRFKVARLLEEARAAGVVRFEIRDPVPVDDELSRALEQRYGLELALVVPEDDLARAGALWLPELLRPDDVVGVAWGATLSALVDELAPVSLGTPVVQICGAIPGLETGTGTAELALRLAGKLGGPLHPLPAPAHASRVLRTALLRNPAVQPTVEMFERVTVALVGIGVVPRGAGHVLVHLFDEHGRALAGDMPAIALSEKQLRRARVIAVAGGAAKRGAVLGALRTGMLNVLVTDAACARAAVA